MSSNIGRTVEDGLAIGRKLLAKRNYHKAVQIHRLLALRFPRDAHIHMALGQSFRGLGNDVRMRNAFRRAIVLRPDMVGSYYNLGNAERSFDQAEAAVKIYRPAVTLAPDRPEIETALSLALLQMGDWSRAWPRYEMRESRREFAEQMQGLGKELWNGERVKGHRVLLVAEQGAGDAIQFIRYARFLADAGMVVQVHCQPALERLFNAVPWIDSVSTVRQPDFDSSCLIMSLPYWFRTTPTSIPSDVPYLAPLKGQASGPLDSGLRVGLAWAGTPKNTRDEWRSCPQAAYAKLLEIPGISFQSLQFGWKSGGAGNSWSAVAPLGDDVLDYADTADVIAGLDLVISVDTSVAHLAGALGKPVWTLLGRHSDWRWLLDRSDTPWYPTMRLFRLGDGDGEHDGWGNLLTQVASALVDLSRERSV